MGVVTGQEAAGGRAATVKWYGVLLIAVGALCSVMLPGAGVWISAAILLVGVAMTWAAVRVQRRAGERQGRDA